MQKVLAVLILISMFVVGLASGYKAFAPSKKDQAVFDLIRSEQDRINNKYSGAGIHGVPVKAEVKN